MESLMLNNSENEALKEMISRAEKENFSNNYEYDPGFEMYSCSCTAHKKSCGWD